jgi:hypothetical protein
MARVLRIAQCMRRRGITGFPDPRLAPPSNQAGYDVIDLGGVFLALPSTMNMASPAFMQAAGACRLQH